jgi:Tfp pilus assembly protein FimV
MSVAVELDPIVDPAFPPAPRRPALRAVPTVAPPRPVAPEPRAVGSVSLLCPPNEPVSWRLTRRGVVVVALAVGLLGAAVVWLAALSAPAASPTPASGPRTVTVLPGDTLWSIATSVAPQRDPRAEVATLQHLNHLAGVSLVPGQQLVVR